MLACSYARDSRDDGNEAFGIDSQTRYNLQYAQKHGFSVPPDYVLEEEWTGKDWSRPKFDTLKQLIEFRRIDAVIIYKVNRISRIDYHALMFLRDFCFRYKVVLHIVEWGRPVKDDSNDVILFGLQAQFGHIERDDIIRRTQRGRREKAEQGIFLGQGTTVYGYEKSGTKKNTALEIIPEEAAIIKLIYGMFVHREIQMVDIARFLNAQNIPSPSERRLWQRSGWNANSILRILRDPRYVGDFYAFRYVKDGQTGKSVLREREQWIKQQFPHLAIIDLETFNLAQEIIDSRKNRYSFAAKYEYLLNKRVFCACGYKAGVQTMVKNGKNHQYYRCAHKRKQRTECKIPYINSVALDIQIWNAVESFLRNPEITLHNLRAAQEQQKQDHRNAVITLDTLEKIRKDYHQRVDRLYSDYERRLIPESVYLQRKVPLDEGLQTAEKLYAEQQAVLDQDVLSDRDIQHITGECRKMADLLDEAGALEFEHKKRIIELLNITGQFIIKESTIILVLFIHNLEFGAVQADRSILENHRSCFLKNVLVPQYPSLQSPISLRIIVGQIKV